MFKIFFIIKRKNGDYTNELKRGEIIVKIMKGTLNKEEASYILNLSIRQIYRLCKKYINKGLFGLAHKNRG